MGPYLLVTEGEAFAYLHTFSCVIPPLTCIRKAKHTQDKKQTKTNICGSHVDITSLGAGGRQAFGDNPASARST